MALFPYHEENTAPIAETAVKENPYQLWIDTYSDDEYDKVVERMISITDKVAEASSSAVQSRMREVFFDSTRLEWMFWDAAYRLEEWPV